MSRWQTFKVKIYKWAGINDASANEKNAFLDEEEQQLEQERLDEIAKQQSGLTKSAKQIRTQEKQNPQFKYVVNEQLEERARFGSRGARYLDEPLDFFSIRSTSRLKLKKQLETVEKDIKSLVEKPLANKSIPIFDEKMVLDELSENEKLIYEKLWRRRKEILAQLKLINEYERNNTEWQTGYDGDASSESVRERVIDFMMESVPESVEKIPFIGIFIEAAVATYSRFKISFNEIFDASKNLFVGTRRKTAIGRIVGICVGSILGAAVMGVGLAVAGSVVPGIGTAVGGVTGIILGAVAGAATGGPVGLEIFNYFSGLSGIFQDEYDYQMDYVHLKHLKKIYGFDPDKMLKMYSYLSNQIRLMGPETNTGKLLSNLKKTALEEGRQDALSKLCRYFIGQEKFLRTELYYIGVASVNNQKEKNDLLNERRALNEKRAQIGEEQEKYEIERAGDPFFKDLDNFIYKNNIKISAVDLMRYVSSSFSDQDIQTQLMGLNTEAANEFVQLMSNVSVFDAKKREDFLKREPKTLWLKEWNNNEKKLAENEEEFLKIQHKRFEMVSERNTIIELLGEFEHPSYFVENNKKNIWVYGKMEIKIEEPIEKLFESVKDGNGNAVRRPKDVRSFAQGDNDDKEGYIVGDMASFEIDKAEFRETMRESAFRNAKKEVSQHDTLFWNKKFEAPNRNVLRKNIVTNNEQLNTLEAFFRCLDQIPVYLDKLSHADENEAGALNDECKRIIFTLQKSIQSLPELSDLVKPQIKALQDIQFYLDYAAIHHVYIRRDLSQMHESPLLDLFPYSEYGGVEHLKAKDGALMSQKAKVRDEMLSRMQGNVLPESVAARIERFALNGDFTPEKFKDAWQETGQLAAQNEVNQVIEILEAIQTLQKEYESAKKDGKHLETNFLYGIMGRANELSHKLNDNLDALSRRALQNEKTWGAAEPKGGNGYLDLIGQYKRHNAVAEIANPPNSSHTELQQIKAAAALPRETSTPKVEKGVAGRGAPENGFSLFRRQSGERKINQDVDLSRSLVTVPMAGFAIKTNALTPNTIVQEILDAFPSVENIKRSDKRMEFTFANISSKLIVSYPNKDGLTEVLMEIRDKEEDEVWAILNKQISVYAERVSKNDRLSKEVTVLAGNNPSFAGLVYFSMKRAGLDPKLQSEELGQPAVDEIIKNYAKTCGSTVKEVPEASKRSSSIKGRG